MRLLLVGLLAAAALAPPPAQVANVRAHPWSEAEGRIGTQDLTSATLGALWNSIIGGGDIECASHATLVVADVEGPPRGYVANGRVMIEATFEYRNGDSTVTGSERLGVFSPQGRYSVALWLPETGCPPIRVRAWVAGDTVVAAGRIEFHCGE